MIHEHDISWWYDDDDVDDGNDDDCSPTMITILVYMYQFSNIGTTERTDRLSNILILFSSHTVLYLIKCYNGVASSQQVAKNN